MTLPEKMYGILLNGYGGPEMLEWRDDLPVPLPGKNDVIVRVGAAGVNNTDINTRTAWYSKGEAEADDATWSGTPLHKALKIVEWAQPRCLYAPVSNYFCTRTPVARSAVAPNHPLHPREAFAGDRVETRRLPRW